MFFLILISSFFWGCGEESSLDKPDILANEDADDDGYDRTIDCNDSSSAIYPGADEVCDGIDNDCDEQIDENPIEGDTYFVDADGDGEGFGDGVVFCDPPLSGYVQNNRDCNDEDGTISRGAEETCDGIDNDCDDQIDEDVLISFYVDIDGDGFGTDLSYQEACEAVQLAVLHGGDCDDSNANIYPDAQELCDGIDNDCNGLSDNEEDPVNQPKRFADQDGDGFGDSNTFTQDCSAEGWIDNNEDCDDNNADINPSIQEICDEIDNNCDGLTDDDDPTTSDSSKSTFYLDSDGDGYGGTSAPTMLRCEQPSGYAVENTDCDDTNGNLSPVTPEICNDGINNNCDFLIDCDDSACDIDPLCVDIDCADGIDSDGDGLTDCRDDDCAGSVDCGEICEADADEDGDGFFECDDSECFFVGDCANGNCPQIVLGSEEGSNVATGNNSNMNNNVDGDCYAGGSSGNDISFLWTAPAGGCVTFDTVGTSYDAVISIFDSCSDLTTGNPISCKDGSMSSGDIISCHTYANQEFYVLIDGYNANQIGDYSLNIDMVENTSCSCSSACCPQ